MDDLVLFVFKHIRNSIWEICFHENSIGIPSHCNFQFELAPKPAQIEGLNEGGHTKYI